MTDRAFHILIAVLLGFLGFLWIDFIVHRFAASKEVPPFKSSITKFEYENHTYIKFKERESPKDPRSNVMAIVHSPDCQCNKH